MRSSGNEATMDCDHVNNRYELVESVLCPHWDEALQDEVTQECMYGHAVVEIPQELTVI